MRATARKEESPAIKALLERLDSTMVSVAPTSHMYATELEKDHSRTLPAHNSRLKKTSNLRSAERETAADILRKFEEGGDTGDGAAAVTLASQLRFVDPAALAARTLESTGRGIGASTAAAAETRRRALAASAGSGSGAAGSSLGVTSAAGNTSGRFGAGVAPATLGTATLSRAELAARYGGTDLSSVPPDAEVRALKETVATGSDPFSRVAAATYGVRASSTGGARAAAGAAATTAPSLAATLAASTSFPPAVVATLKPARGHADTVGALLAAAGAAGDFTTDYSRSFVQTAEVSPPAAATAAVVAVAGSPGRCCCRALACSWS